MKRTNKIYQVQVVAYAWVAVEADNEEAAIDFVKENMDEMMTEDCFDDSDVEVRYVEDEVYSIDDVSEDTIWTCDGVMTKKAYKKAMKGGAE